MRKLLPILTWLPQYPLSHLRHDIFAGLTVGTMLIPQGMAFALLAGMPPIAGLYAALGALLIYPLLGTSPHVAVGPVAMDSLLVAVGVSALAVPGTPDYISLVIILTLLVGIFQLIMGITRMGFLVNFLSQPVINGFASAAAIIISFSQLKYLLRVEMAGSQQILTVIWRLWQHLPESHFPTLLLGLGCIALLLALKRWKPRWPALLIVIILSTVVVWWAGLDQLGVPIVGTVPRGLPHPGVPAVDLQQIEALAPFALTLSLVSFMEAIAIARKFAARADQEVDANQELVALGVSNMMSGLLGGYSVTASFSRSAVNVQAGARSQLALWISALVIILTLLFLTPLFYYLPRAALAAIVIVSVLNLVDTREPRRLYRIRKEDFTVLLFAFFSTLLLGARWGLVLSIAASLILIIRRISRPQVAVLGRIPGTNIFRNIQRAPEAQEIEGLVIFRIFASLYFANIGYLREQIRAVLRQRKDRVQAFLLDASSINEIDAPAIAALEEIAHELEARGIRFYMSNIRGPVRDVLERAGFFDKIGRDHFFYTREAAVENFLKRQAESS